MNINLIVILVLIVILFKYSATLSKSLYKGHKIKTSNKISFKESIDLTTLPIVTFKHLEKKINFLLDTGASNSVINESVLTHIDHKPTGLVEDFFGVDGNKSSGEYVTIEIEYNGKTFSDNFKSVNLDKCFGEIKREYGVNLHGILGNSFFQKYKYIIDFDEFVAYSIK